MTDLNDSSSNANVPAEVLHPVSRQLFCYWERLRGEASVPLREHIDLKQITRIVPWLSLIERPGPGRPFAWRLAGTGVCRMWGQELTGRQVLAGWTPGDRDTLTRALDGVATTLQPFVARFAGRCREGDDIGIELLALPVQPGERRPPHVLASLLPFREPAWSGERPLLSFALSSLRVIWTEPLPGEGTRLLLPARRPKGFLRVIDGGLAPE